ncbi:MAG: diaminopimelate epimerase [Alphaproteobacteria bacterium]
MLHFIKMHGLGNDFVVLDWRGAPDRVLTPAQARFIADRRRGIGCDQIVILQPGRGTAEATVRFLNADGSSSGACGNATRCIAGMLMQETGANSILLASQAGGLKAWWSDQPGGDITVDMGPVRLGWQAIPLAEPANTQHMPIEIEGLRDGIACNIGNPHITFFVADVEDVALERLGPQIETHPLFPERVNVEVAEILHDGAIRMRVWERGAGITEACGSGACATLVNAVRHGLSERQAQIIVDGGVLEVEWREQDEHVLLTGPWATVATGDILLPEPAEQPKEDALA